MAADRRQRYRKRDRLRQLQAFCEVAKLGTMTGAAERLHISQPAVSLHIRELEHELGVALFERNGPRIALSPAGVRFFEFAASLVEATDGLDREFAVALDDLEPGELRVASGDAGASYVLPRAFRRLLEDCPGTRVHLRCCLLAEALGLLLDDEVELVLSAEERVSQEFEYRPALSYALVLIASPGHPLAGRESVIPEEIAACPVIVPEFGTYSMQSGESPLRRLGIEANAAIEVDGWDAVEEFVAAGLGVAFFPSFCVTDESRVSVVPLREYFEKRSYGWFMRRGKPLSRSAERLVHAVGAEAPDAPD